MRPQLLHVRAAVIAAVLSAIAACSGDSAVSPSADSALGNIQPTVVAETTASIGVISTGVVASAASASANKAPTGWILTPAHNSLWAAGASIAFSGFATDPEQGMLSGSSVVWKSSKDGQIGTGTSFTRKNLSGGTHTITMTVTDAQGASYSHNRTINVAGGVANTAPVASITSPANNASVVQGTSVSFAGSASDTESGALSGAALTWGSSLAGQIGTGTSFSTSGLAVGTHTIAMVAIDPQGAADTVVRTLIVTAPVTAANQDPFGLISTPAHGATFAQGTSISFTGSASDPEDGALTGASLVWSSSVAGQIGTGTSFTKNNLAAGTHTITLTTTDSKGASFSHNRVITITAAAAPVVNQAPTAAISAPTNGAGVTQGANVTFTGSGSDQESGALSGASLVWTSSRDGQIGTGTSFSKTNLTVGTHTITLTAKDPQNAVGTATRTITINAAAPVNTAPVANFTANCLLLICSFDASSSTDNAGVANYAWNFGSGLINRTIATISNTFIVAGTVNVSLTVTDAAGLTNTITKSVSMSAGTTTPPPSGSSFEPSGMTMLAQNAFNCLTGCGGWTYWDASYANASTLVTDMTAPVGGSGVVQQNFTPSLQGGYSPASFGTTLTQRQTIYVAMYMKLSSNYQGHNTGVNKVLHFFTKPGMPAGNVAIFNIRGSGSGTLVPGFLLQGLAIPLSYAGNTATEANIDAAASTCTVSRGAWHKFEVVLVNNTPGSANGTGTIWMDGKKCIEQSGIGFVASGQVNKWSELWWSPTWGGLYDTVQSTFYEAVDNIYVSGK